MACVQLWCGAAAVLLSVTKDKSYKWNLEMDPVPSTLVQQMCKEMETNKGKVKCEVLWLLLCVI